MKNLILIKIAGLISFLLMLSLFKYDLLPNLIEVVQIKYL